MNEERMYEIIRFPIVSEKSTRLGEKSNQFVFEVARSATKPEIRKAVEKLFDVRVVSVQVANIRGKRKRFGRTMGKQIDRRRAFVRLHSDDDINFTDSLE